MRERIARVSKKNLEALPFATSPGLCPCETAHRLLRRLFRRLFRHFRDVRTAAIGFSLTRSNHSAASHSARLALTSLDQGTGANDVALHASRSDALSEDSLDALLRKAAASIFSTRFDSRRNITLDCAQRSDSAGFTA
ncbi:hypothetical protein BCAR13_110010 [Paraburkholderia caribensis]|nr:hypothetical protein BCAR13_110010 [Paraburkholderia caribensis]